MTQTLSRVAAVVAAYIVANTLWLATLVPAVA